MRFLRPLLKTVLVLALLALLLGGLLAIPAVQTWVVQQALPDDSGIAVEGVRVRPGRVEVTGFRLERDGRRFTAARAVAELSLRQLVWHHRAAVSRLTASGCRWEKTETNPPPEVRRPWPIEVTVAAAVLDGTSDWHPTLPGSGIPFHFHIEASARAVRHEPLDWKAHTVAESPGRGLILDANLVPGQLRGRWTAALDDKQLAALAAPTRLPRCTVHGGGAFAQENSGEEMRVSGTLEGDVAPEVLGSAMPYRAEFSLVRNERRWRFDRAELESRRDAARLEVAAAQPFEFDLATGRVRFASPSAPGVRIRLADVPLAALPPLPAGQGSLHLDQGTVSGELSVTPQGTDGIAFRSPAPLHLAAPGWDGDANVSGQIAPERWEVRLAPGVWRPKGWRQIRAELAASRVPEEGQPWVIEGRIEAAVDGVASVWREGSAKVSAIAGDGVRLDAEIRLQGLHPGDTATSSAHLEVDRDGAGELLLPLKITIGSDSTDATLDLTRISDENGERWYAKTSGTHTDFDQLRTLVAPWLPPARHGPRPEPWWGGRTGKVSGQFETFSSAHLTFSPLDGALVFEPARMRLEDWHVVMPDKRQLEIAGGLDFHPNAMPPYTGQLTYTEDKVEAGPLFPDRANPDQPWVEGRFTVHHRMDTAGESFGEFYANRRESIEADSKTAIVRLLRVNVGDAVPEQKTTVREGVGGAVGSVVGKIFGTKTNPLVTGLNPVSPRAEAVLQFTYETAEIGFDALHLTAEQLADGGYRLSRISGTSDTVRLEGTGTVGPRGTRTLSLDLNLSFRGGPAEQLAKAGVIARAKDSKTFVPLGRVIHFGGTLERVDQTQWHDFLAVAIRGK